MKNYESAPSAFPTPKTQELSLLSKKIQEQDNDYVRDEIKRNPRLLATSSDAPTVLQEGFRYNALHVAARCGNVGAAQIILSAVNGTDFMKALYPDDPETTRLERTRFLTDMYLNTPERGTLETPLHFACKFGFYEVAKLLVGHPLCDSILTNGESKTPREVIGSRATGTDAADQEILGKLFTHNRIVPIWRDINNDTAAVVGRPVNPKYLGRHTPKSFTSKYGDVTMDLFGPVDESCVPKNKLGIHWEIRAYAGPSDELTALRFYETLKGMAPVTYASQHPSSPKGGDHSPDLATLYNSKGQPCPTTPRRPLRPLPLSRKSIHGTPTSVLAPTSPERLSKDDSFVFKTPLEPLSKPLPSPKAFQYTPETLSLLLTSSAGYHSPGQHTPNRVLEDRKLRRRDPEKGVERVGRKYATELNICWAEYWVFLSDFLDLSSETGLVLFEEYLVRAREKQLEEEHLKNKAVDGPTFLNDLCSNLQKLNLDGIQSQTRIRKPFSPDWRSGLTKIRSVENAGGERRRLGHHGNKIESGVTASLPTTPVEDRPKIKLGIRKLFELQEQGLDPNAEGDFMALKTQPDSPRPFFDEEAWKTPTSSPYVSDESDGDDDQFEDCATLSLFIHGAEPTKEDFQVMRASGTVIDDLSPEQFPQIVIWYNSVKALGHINM